MGKFFAAAVDAGCVVVIPAVFLPDVVQIRVLIRLDAIEHIALRLHQAIEVVVLVHFMVIATEVVEELLILQIVQGVVLVLSVGDERAPRFLGGNSLQAVAEGPAVVARVGFITRKARPRR